jgi:hypothetical protein
MQIVGSVMVVNRPCIAFGEPKTVEGEDGSIEILGGTDVRSLKAGDPVLVVGRKGSRILVLVDGSVWIIPRNTLSPCNDDPSVVD